MISVATLEVPHRFGAVEAQLAWVAANLPRADLVVLPEAAITGYVSRAGDFDLTAFAEPRGGATERACVALARERGCALVAPLIERDGAACYNSALFIDSSGDILTCYRKRHPWMPETWATPGPQSPCVFRWRELTLTLAICFDIHFLGEDASAALTRADALLFPSAWTELNDTRPQMLPALARAFGCAVINANWGHGVPRIAGQGQSLIISGAGDILASGGPVARAVLAPRARV